MRQSVAYRMNSTLLASPERTILIDPGVLPSEMDDIAGVAGGGPTTLIFTHAHWDHVLGRTWWPASGTIAHDAFAAESKREEHTIDHAARDAVREAGEEWDMVFEGFTPDLSVRGERAVRIEPWLLIFRDAFGHSDSQMTVHVPESRVLVAADMLSDVEIPMLDRPPDVYRATLRGLEPLFEAGEIETVIPGHGSVATGANARARLHRDLQYLEALEAGVREAHGRGDALEVVQRRLEPLDFIGRHAEFPMDEVHRENIRIAFEATAAAGERS